MPEVSEGFVLEAQGGDGLLAGRNGVPASRAEHAHPNDSHVQAPWLLPWHARTGSDARHVKVPTRARFQNNRSVSGRSSERIEAGKETGNAQTPIPYS